jgi:hypothetical protein
MGRASSSHGKRRYSHLCSAESLGAGTPLLWLLRAGRSLRGVWPGVPASRSRLHRRDTRVRATHAMDVRKMITELRAERAEIERAINALQKVGGKRRGRPPKAADARAQRKKSKDEPPE